MKEMKVGMTHSHTYTIPKNKTVPHLYPEDELFQKMPDVFATGFMVGLIEMTCMQALEEHLEEGEGSVGVHIDVSHIAPTPPGNKVTVTIKVSKIEGNKITWDSVAKDEHEIISEGTHTRFVIHLDRFHKRVLKKHKSI